MDLIRSGEYEYIDRKSAKTPEESRALYGRIVTADYYLMSTNAITKEGELINVDGVGNRVACLSTARTRTDHHRHEQSGHHCGRRYPPVRNIAAPPNSIRVGSKTPCSVTGFCSDCQSR